MAILIDKSGTAAAPDAATFAGWASDQRVFISSVMAELADLRASLAAGITNMGATPVSFEDFGGRDDDSEVAYLGEVASSTLYLGILGSTYGALDKRTRLSATHTEYREAEKLGLPVSVWVRGTEEMKADQYAFLQEVRTFHTTGGFESAEGLVERVRQRFEELAAETVSPWVKLGPVVMRARTVIDDGTTMVVSASVHSPEVRAALEAMRPDNFHANEQRLTWAGSSVPVRVISVQTTISAARSSEVEVRAERTDSRGQSHSFMRGRITTNGRTFTAEELAVFDVRHVLFAEPEPPDLFGFGSGFGDLLDGLPPATLPTAQYQAGFSVVVTEALVACGHALRVDRAQVSPTGPQGRQVRLAWTAPGNSRSSPGDLVSVDGTMPTS